MKHHDDAINQILHEAMDHDVPPEVDRRLRTRLAAFRARLDARPTQPSLWDRLSALPRWAKAIPIATPALIALAVGLFYLWGTRGIAFADVLKQLRVFRPYACTSTVKYEGKPAYSRRVMHLSLSRRREVWANGAVVIFDMSHEPVRILSLFPKEKRGFKKTLLGKGPASDPDLLRMVGAMKDGAAEDLGKKKVDGWLARGFHVPGEINDITVWVDPKTALPIRFEVRHPKLHQEIIMSDFDFDVDFDESLFSTEPPDGYTVHESETVTRTLGETDPGFRPFICTSTVQDEGKAARSVRLMRLSLSRRREIDADGNITVVDLSQEPIKGLEIQPDEKTAVETTVIGRGPTKDPNILAMARDFRPGSEDLGIRDAEGRPAKGFRARRPGHDWTFWIDPETELPICIELIHTQTGRKITWSHFEFDVDLDESLFSTEAPEGYSVEKRQVGEPAPAPSADASQDSP